MLRFLILCFPIVSWSNSRKFSWKIRTDFEGITSWILWFWQSVELSKEHNQRISEQHTFLFVDFSKAFDFIYRNIYNSTILLLCIYPTPLLRVGSDIRSIFKQSADGLNWEFSFSSISCYTRVKELGLPYYLLITQIKRPGFKFSQGFLCKQPCLSQIRTRVTDFILYNDNLYTKRAFISTTTATPITTSTTTDNNTFCEIFLFVVTSSPPSLSHTHTHTHRCSNDGKFPQVSRIFQSILANFCSAVV